MSYQEIEIRKARFPHRRVISLIRSNFPGWMEFHAGQWDTYEARDEASGESWKPAGQIYVRMVEQKRTALLESIAYWEDKEATQSVCMRSRIQKLVMKETDSPSARVKRLYQELDDLNNLRYNWSCVDVYEWCDIEMLV